MSRHTVRILLAAEAREREGAARGPRRILGEQRALAREFRYPAQSFRASPVPTERHGARIRKLANRPAWSYRCAQQSTPFSLEALRCLASIGTVSG